MKKQFKILQSMICIMIVLTVMFIAFFNRSTIENYAATGYLGVLVACIASTSTILLPAPGILVVLQYATILNPLAVILIGGVGTAFGELIGYCFGRSGNEIINLNTSLKLFQTFAKHPRLWIFMFSVIPLPVFDIVGICAGVARMGVIDFFISCFLGKTIKMTIFVIAFQYMTVILQKL